MQPGRRYIIIETGRLIVSVGVSGAGRGGGTSRNILGNLATYRQCGSVHIAVLFLLYGPQSTWTDIGEAENIGDSRYA